MRHLIFLVLLLLLPSCGKKSTGALRVGMELNYPPFETQLPDGKPDGVSVKLAEALAADLGRPVEIVPMKFPALIPALKSGTIDLVISSMTDTPERRQSIDFSDPYAKIGLSLLVPANSAIRSAEDLKSPGRKIAVKSSTTGEAWSAANLPQATVIAFPDDSACVLEVIQGRADAFIYDQLSILRYQKKNASTTRAILEPFAIESWAVGISKANPELRDGTNAFLKKFREIGGLENLTAQYLSAEKAELSKQGIASPLQ